MNVSEEENSTYKGNMMFPFYIREIYSGDKIILAIL